MKRTKNFLSVIVAFLLAFVMAFALTACDSNTNDNGGDQGGDKPAPSTPDKSAEDLGITEGPEGENLSLLGITITTLPRTLYNLNQEFTSTGLVVRATYLDSTVAPDPLNPDANLKTEAVAAADYKIDNSDFDNTRVGIYNIYVSYTYLGVTRTASYQVTVNAEDPAYGGIIAELAAGATDTYYLTSDAPSVVIPQDIVSVYKVQEDGTKSETALEADAYTAELYLGSQKIENNEAKENGTYSLVVTLKDDAKAQDFIPVYVVNPVKSIELDKTAGGVFTQAPGMVDHMSETWQFTVTYESGVKKTVKAGDEGLTIELDTRSAGAKTATVTYVEGTMSVTCTVAYTIASGGTTQPAGDPLVINISDLFDAGTLAVQDYSEDVVLGADDNTSVSVLATADAKVSVDANKKSMDEFSFTHRLKLGGKGTNVARSIKIEVSGAAIITVYMMSSSSSDSREVGIWTGEFDPAETPATIEMQTVGGASLEKHEYEVSAAGTYYLAAKTGGTNVYGIIVSPVGGGSTEQPVQPAGDPLEVNISDLFNAGTLAVQDYAEDVVLGIDDNTSVSVLATADAKVSVDANKKSMDGYEFTHRLKLGGKGTNVARSIKVEVSGAAILTVYMMSSSSGDSRDVGIWTGEFDPAETPATVEMQTVGGASLEKHEYELPAAGTYYLAAKTGGTNVYGVLVTPLGGGSQPVEPSQPVGEPLEINISDLITAGTLAAGDYTAETALGANDYSLVSVLANEDNKVSVDSNSKSMDGYTFTHRLKLSGKGTDAARSIKIEVSGAAIITVYMMSSSSGDSREVGIWTGEFDPAETPATIEMQTVGGASLEKHEYEVTAAGTYYLAAKTGGTNVYGIIVTPIG